MNYTEGYLFPELYCEASEKYIYYKIFKEYIYQIYKEYKNKTMAQKVLRFTYNEAVARTEVTHLGGRIIHQFTPTAFVAELQYLYSFKIYLFIFIQLSIFSYIVINSRF